MSCVFVGVGQCGNQINCALWKLLEPYLGNLNICNGDGKFPAVNIDSERKVIKNLWHQFGNRYIKNNLITGIKGCGSNWAIGYYGNKDSCEDSLLSRTVDAIRREIERCSSFSGMILIHSLAGGTGSGLGSLLHQMLKDEYPMNYILSCVIAPHDSGESPLQNYNSALCLSSIHDNTDGILLFKNDEVLQKSQPRKQEQKSDTLVSVSVEHCNQYIARCLADLILPTDSVSGNSSRCAGLGLEAWELVRSVAPMPATKFIHATRMSCSSQNVEKNAVKVANHQHVDDQCTNIAGLFIVRGNVPAFPVESLIKRLKFVSWNPFPVDLWSAKVNPLGPGKLVSLAAATNCSAVVPFLERTTTKARVMFDAKAYLHWYTKHGSTNDDFLQAFTNLDTTTSSYIDSIR